MAHASDMTRPTKLSVPDVDIDCLEPQPASELRVADVVSPHVPPCDAAHDPDAPVVERAQPRQQILGQAPAFRTAKGDIDNQSHIYHLLGLE